MKYQEKYLKNENGWQKVYNNEIKNFSRDFFLSKQKDEVVQYNVKVFYLESSGI